MSPQEIGYLGLAALVAMVLLRVPVAVALGLVGYVGYASIDGAMKAGLILGGAPVELAQAYTFSVVPLFTLMGTVAAVSGLSGDLFRAANACLRGARGGLPVAAILASGMFGAICGSSVATALTMSRVSIPVMLEERYPASLAAGAVAAGGTLGILIPPSLILMIYAIIAQLSVAQLFAAALIPGLMLTLLYALVALWQGRRKTAALFVGARKAPLLLPALGRIWHVVGLFLVTIGGIYSGFFTPTEAAAVGALGALLIALITGRTGARMISDSFLDSTRLVASVIFIVMASSIFSYFIVQTGLSGQIALAIKGLGLGPMGAMILLCVVYILLGCVMEGVAMILITVPIVLPIVLDLGFDPVWFGVLLVILVEIGLVTPPLGMNLFVIKAVSPGLLISDIYRGALPFLIAPLVLIAMMLAWPGFVLWLPGLIN